MKLRVLKNIVPLLAIMLVALSCEDYFGKQTDLDFIEVPDYNATRDAAYVPILPVLDQFTRPTDVLTGFDELIYVVDNGTEEVIVMDESGRILSRKYIPGAISVAQDRAFDLLVIGTTDTTLIQGNDTIERTLSTIYRLDQFASGTYDLASAAITNKIIHPFYVEVSANDFDEVDFVRFNNIAIIAGNDPDENNSFFVTREGESTTGTLGPDDAVLLFTNYDEFVSGINVNTSTGVFNDYFADPSGITTYAQPPQLTVQTGRDFIFTSLDNNNALQVQLIQRFETELTAYYQPSLLAADDTSQAEGFINSTNKFSQPTAITMAGDATGYIFVTDMEKDSVYQFTPAGFEGVEPPPGSNLEKFIKVSFGGTGTGETQFNDPMGVAYFNEVLYVADAGNGRVLRFKLTLDFE